ncbi:urease accessory protein UreF [filamentous cyanobacterium CCP5]|nr:urease accessory protein UreF [filamentous cyanobacterium CCP5]
MTDLALLRLLQLASPALPVGAFSYSEGLETLVEQRVIQGCDDLAHWLTQELNYGAIRIEAAVMVRSHRHAQAQEFARLAHWNRWFSALRETQELRQQSWQMGRALIRTVEQIHPELQPAIEACGVPCNFAVAFGLTAAHWQIPLRSALSGYLHSWATNLVNAAVKLVPLGQTAGQRTLLELYPAMAAAATAIAALSDDELDTSGWGSGLASMQHEALYSRLFRS